MCHIKERFHWRGISTEVATSRHGFLSSIARSAPFDDVAIDILSFTGGESRGPDGESHILVMYDLFTHFLIAVPLILVHGAPGRFITDNEFDTILFKEILSLSS